jgi:hypothetical protein
LTRAACTVQNSDEESGEDAEGDDDGDDQDEEDSQGDGSGSASSGREARDWYDEDDPFIDDSELLEEPEEEAGKTKHNGFFINKVRCLHVGSLAAFGSASLHRAQSSGSTTPRTTLPCRPKAHTSARRTRSRHVAAACTLAVLRAVRG